MNRLYGLLVDPDTGVDRNCYYWKRHDSQAHTKKSEAIRSRLVGMVPSSRLPLFACFICHEILDSDFGHDIVELDPLNTYSEVHRQPGQEITASNLCVWDLTRELDSMKTIISSLDQDIKDRLAVGGWLDYMAAGCLQMLRETKDGR